MIESRMRRPVRSETWHLMRRRRHQQGGLIDAEDLVALARAEGLTDDEIRQLACNLMPKRRRGSHAA